MDRGEGHEFKIIRCERGFIITYQDGAGCYGSTWAFDNIDDAAKWLVEQWNPVSPCANTSQRPEDADLTRKYCDTTMYGHDRQVLRP